MGVTKIRDQVKIISKVILKVKGGEQLKGVRKLPNSIFTLSFIDIVAKAI